MTAINAAVASATTHTLRPHQFEPMTGNPGSSAFLSSTASHAEPTRLDRLMVSPSALDRLSAAPSLVAQSRGAAERVTITVQAPIRSPIGWVDRTRNIEITVRPLEGRELGSLNASPASVRWVLADAAGRINDENVQNYGRTTAELRQEATDSGYFESPPHVASSMAAEARTGGRVPASWWRENDPFGGTAGNGPDIKPLGIYPGDLSTIAMAHDTDWTLGRQFGAGPLRALETMEGTANERGFYGLGAGIRGDPSYSLGHSDWQVRYTDYR